MSVAQGFAAAGVRAGIRRSALDLAVVRSTVPAVGAAMPFTINQLRAGGARGRLEAAPGRGRAAGGRDQPGVANAATGVRGELDALATAAEAADKLELEAEEVLVLPTGVIGTLLPLHKVTEGLPPAAPALSTTGGADAAEAILTTDTRPKEALSVDGFTVGGMAKGSGMIHPQLATMLAVVTTDYPLAPGEAIDFPPRRRPQLQLDLGRR